MKAKRQEMILQLIGQGEMETQEQLLEGLRREGFQTTQATISRDIKELRVLKKLGPDGTYRYRLSESTEESSALSKLELIFKECIISADHAQNMLVVKTMPGLASAACSALDQMKMPEILGTLAGDDTAFVVMRDTASATALCADLRRQIGK